ncbi:hypothetical protein NKG05_21350 [Oerskovia sp. M15]
MRAAFRRLTWRSRSSMQLRVVGTALVVGLVTVAALGAYLSSTMRDGLFEQRIEQIDLEGASSIQQAQSLFTASLSTTEDAEVQTLLLDVHNALRTSGSPDRKVFLMRPEGAQSRLNDVSTDNQLVSLVSPELRTAVMESDGRELQSVAIPRNPSDPSSAVDPGCSWAPRSRSRPSGSTSCTSCTRSSPSRRRCPSCRECCCSVASSWWGSSGSSPGS